MREGPYTYTHSTVTVGSATTALAAADDDRRGCLIQNLSNEAVYIKVGAAAVASAGIQLIPVSSGNVQETGIFEMSDAKGNLSVAAINGICASGSKSVLVTTWK